MKQHNLLFEVELDWTLRYAYYIFRYKIDTKKKLIILNMLDKIPVEIFLKICQYLNNPKDLRSLAVTTKQNYIYIKKYFINKEKWKTLSIKNDKLLIKKSVQNGFRFIYHNNKIQYIYNLIRSEDNIQVITQYELISSIKKVYLLNTIIYNYSDAPYNMKVKPLKI